MPLVEKSKPKVAFLCPYGRDTAPGQRFRVELYYEYIEDHLEFETFHFLDKKTSEILYKNGKWLRKFLAVGKGFLSRFRILLLLRSYDYIFIFRESTPLGPPIIEFILSKILNKKLIYDFDDAIWLDNTSDENKIVSLFKWHNKVKSICKWSYKISAGNLFLKTFAQKYNSNAFIIPTIVDTIKKHSVKKQITKDIPVVGWTGSFSTLRYLAPLIPILQELEKKHDFKFILIADKDPQLDLKKYEFIRWNSTTEIEDLSRIDIGLMPLDDNKWCQGKCGFKAIQYMSLGMPALVSPVGVNKEIVDHNVNGYICNTPEDWKQYLSQLLEDRDLRQSLGKKARNKIVNEFSLEAILPDFLKLFHVE